MKSPLSDSDLVRIAGAIRERLTRSGPSRLARVEHQVEQLLFALDRLKAVRRKLALCRERHLAGAVPRLLEQLDRPLREVPYALGEISRAEQAARTRAPPLREIYLDLRQTQEEFGGLRHDRGHQALSVVTDPIELEGFHFGEFEIRLEIARLAEARQVPYSVIALDPHPAASNEAVTHPHVRDDRLCEGDAGAAIHAALDGGRIFDFFTLVRSVLSTYNPQSPYVSLDDWYGTSCYECGYVMGQDDVRWCQLCEQDFCDECTSCCSRCDETTCLGCLRSCPVCEESVCTRCMTACPDCGGELCQMCLEEEQCPCHEDEEKDNESNTSQNETDQGSGRQGVDQQPQGSGNSILRIQDASAGGIGIGTPEQAAAG